MFSFYNYLLLSSIFDNYNCKRITGDDANFAPQVLQHMS